MNAAELFLLGNLKHDVESTERRAHAASLRMQAAYEEFIWAKKRVHVLC